MKSNWIKTICLTFLLWVMVLPIASVLAIPISDIPNPRKLNGKWVSDVANILSADTEIKLNQKISQLEARNGSEIAVVTVPDTSPLPSPKAYATELFNTWGIGKRDINNGVLFLISVNDRRIEIETGRGITAHLSNTQVTQIIETKIKPEFKLQKFDQGTINGVDEIANHLEKTSFSPLDFVPIYSNIGFVGITLTLLGVVWTVLKINSWCQLLPSISKSINSPLLFQLKIQKLNQIAKFPLLLIAFGIGAIASSASALLLSSSSTSLTLTQEQNFLSLLFTNVAMAVVTIPAWFGITYYWLAKLTRVLQKKQPPQIWKLFGVMLVRNLFLLLIIQCLLLFVVGILISTKAAALFSSHILFVLISLIIAVSYQLFLIHVVNNVLLDERITEDRYFCAACRKLTHSLNQPLFGELGEYLTKPELLAMELGNATYSVYFCDRCYPENPRDRQHIYCHPHILKEDSVCAKCQHPTMIAADLSKSHYPQNLSKHGSKDAVSIMQCQNCFHEQLVYPYITQSVSKRKSYDRDNDHSYYSSSDSSSSNDSGSSSSDSDFGGGGSDGGGAGGDW